MKYLPDLEEQVVGFASDLLSEKPNMMCLSKTVTGGIFTIRAYCS